ncbi:uncharacterized protein EV420DRAFT_1743950 [Desarmillaria tabescens]|uniref:Uncharacterized protein n=1 Tax=Armillaria tabescens TaxID=1929756 RepID=A0AA39TXK3_ARMTA|nr:uncharacterized protein EV420DRAFT_1743950 [Desarmillaria tabescens]KAK0466109.1 hypothetical protein EV420DRAFT_1743950 [Desarmillaria tabescens]
MCRLHGHWQVGAVREELRVLDLESDGVILIECLRRANTWVQIEERWDICRMYLHLGVAWLFAACLLPVLQVMPRFRAYRNLNEVYCIQKLQEFYFSLGAYAPSDEDATASSNPPVVVHRNTNAAHDVSTTQPKRAVTLRTSLPHHPAGLTESSTYSSELSTPKNPSYPLQNLKRDPFRVRAHMLKGKAGPLCPITRHSEGTKGTDFATGKPRNRESGGLVERGRHSAPVIGPMPTGPIPDSFRDKEETTEGPT